MSENGLERALPAVDSPEQELAALRSFKQRVQTRVGEMMEIIFAVAARDYTQRAVVDGEDDLLNGLCAGLNAMVEELQSSSAFGGDILTAMTDMVVMVGRDGAIELANDAAVRTLGHSREELLGRPFATILAGSSNAFTAEEWIRELGSKEAIEVLLVGTKGQELVVSLSASPLFGLRAEIEGIVFVARDISESKRIEAERMRLAEDVGKKTAEIRELSTPLLPIDDGIIAMPLIGSVDEARARQILDTLLAGVQQFGAHVVIIDVTGVAVVDSHVADSILRAVRATRLLGARVVLTGIRSAVARTLTTLDVDMSEVVLRSTFKSGIDWARAARA